MKVENNLRQEKEKLTKIANSFNQEEYDYYLSLTNQQKFETICQELILNQSIQQIPLRFRIHISQLPTQLKQNLVQKLQTSDQDPTDQESVKFRQYVENVLKLPLNIYQNLDNSFSNSFCKNNFVNQIPDTLKQYLQNVFIYKKQKNQDINPTQQKKETQKTVPVYLEDIIQQIIKKHGKKRGYPFSQKKEISKKLKKKKLNPSPEPSRSANDNFKTKNNQKKTNYTLEPFQDFINYLNQEQQNMNQQNDTHNQFLSAQEDTESEKQQDSSFNLEQNQLLQSDNEDSQNFSESILSSDILSTQQKQNNNRSIVKKNQDQKSLFLVKLKKYQNDQNDQGTSEQFIVNQEILQNFLVNQIDQEECNMVGVKLQDQNKKKSQKGTVKLNKKEIQKAQEVMETNNIQIKNIKQQDDDNYYKNSMILKKISDQLDKEIYDQQEAKQQLLQIMAKWIRSPESTGITIGLQSPPGCGKTALVKNGLAKALNRPVQFINLGGMKDLSVLKGHSYCYVGSTYGLISQALIKSKCMNPIIVFDELDKLDEQQNQISQFLMHMTDPTQNQTFIDDYFHDILIDLSKCMIIFTYNNSEKINKILYDRIHEVKMQGYNIKQKVEILQKFSTPKILKNYQFSSDQMLFNYDIFFYLVQNYSQQEGIRKLEHYIEQIIANINLQYYINNNNDSNQFKQVTITKKMIDKVLQNQRKDTSYAMMYI